MANVAVSARGTALKLEDVVETGEVLGNGSYGIVLELKMKGLR